MQIQPQQQITDIQLVHRGQAGDWDAFEELVNRYERAVYSLACRILWDSQEAEKVTKNTFLVALDRLASFPRETGFGPWVLSLATHEIFNTARSWRSPRKVPLWTVASDNRHARCLASQPRSSRKAVPTISELWDSAPDLIKAVLAQLNESQMIVFLLRDMEGLSIGETAAALKVSEKNVKTRLNEVQCRVRQHLEKRSFCTSRPDNQRM